jgi:hypothetical protein
VARKALTKKTRFEVFKRDSFTCQYCGRSSPDVVLNADHIVPIAEGGANEVLNLITACFECNAGKSDRKLDDSAVVRKQIEQLKEINARREQIQMIAEWRRGLKSVEDHLREAWQITLSPAGKKKFRASLRKYGLNLVLESLDKSADSYLHDPTDEAQIEKYLNYSHRICYWTDLQKKDPGIEDVSKICGIATSRNWKVARSALFLKLRTLHKDYNVPLGDLRELVAGSSGIMAFHGAVDEYLGEPYGAH